MKSKTIMRRTVKVNVAFARMAAEMFREKLIGRRIPATFRKELENDFQDLMYRRDRAKHRAVKLDMKDWMALGE